MPAVDMNERRVDWGQEARMGPNEPLTQEILRQLKAMHTKMDSFGRALEQLARVEERQAAAKDTLERYWQATAKNERAVAALEASLTELRRESRGRLEIHALWGLSALSLGALGWALQQVLGG